MTGPSAPNSARPPGKPIAIPPGAVARRARGGPGWNVKAIAILAAALVAGVVVIGFVLRNIDNRAQEIAKRQNLPWGIEANNRGVKRASRGELQEAIREYDEAIRLSPDFAVPWSNRGATRIEIGELDKGIADCDRAIKLDPKLAEAWASRAMGKFWKNDLDGALADAEAAIGLDASCAQAFVGRAYVRTRRDDIDGAITDYSSAIKAQPLALAYCGRGKVLLAKRDFDGALADFDAAINMNTLMADAWSGRAEILLIRDKAAEALKCAIEALSIEPGDPDALALRGYAHMMLTEFPESIRDLEEALQKAPAGWQRRKDVEEALANANDSATEGEGKKPLK